MKKNYNKELNRILKVFNTYYGFNIIEKTRKQEYFFARCVFFKVARIYTKVGLETLAEFSGITHASVINALKVFDLNIKKDSIIRRDYSKIMFLYSDFFENDKKNDIELYDNKMLLNKFDELENQNNSLKLELISQKENSIVFNHSFINIMNKMPLDIITHFYETRFIPYCRSKNLQLNN